MRDLILAAIAEYRQRDAFTHTFRWNKSVQIGGVHISKVDFAALSDTDLLDAYTLIVRRASMQMG